MRKFSPGKTALAPLMSGQVTPEITAAVQKLAASAGKYKVISRSNENEPTQTGLLIGFHTFTNGGSVPIVEIDGKTMYCMSIVVPFNQALFDQLEAFTNPKDAWAWLAKECQEGRVVKVKSPSAVPMGAKHICFFMVHGRRRHTFTTKFPNRSPFSPDACQLFVNGMLVAPARVVRRSGARAKQHRVTVVLHEANTLMVGDVVQFEWFSE